MRIKLDESLGERGRQLLVGGGYDVATTQEAQLAGSTHVRLIAHCKSEGRCLVTLDLDFANPLRFPPEEYGGLAVRRPPARPSMGHIENCFHTLNRAARNRD